MADGGVEVLDGVRIEFKKGEQDADLGKASGIDFSIGPKHGEPEGPEVQKADGGLLGRHAESRAKAMVDLADLALQCPVGGGVEIQQKVLERTHGFMGGRQRFVETRSVREAAGDPF